MADEDSTALREAILDALRMIIDPEIGGNIVDLGLIYEVKTSAGGVAEITMTTTTRGCPASSYLNEAVQNSAQQVPGVDHADVHLTYEPPWSPDMIRDAEAASRFS